MKDMSDIKKIIYMIEARIKSNESKIENCFMQSGIDFTKGGIDELKSLHKEICEKFMVGSDE